jgi:small subunit ribosomal protein S20
LALEALRKKGAGSQEEIKPIESMIAEAFSIIDKSVKVGTLHKNTGGNRKSRLSRAKRAVEIQLGLYTPAAKA